ncbi:hypothetical protein ACH4MU_29955 [Streptomyces albidoflavus]
MGLPLNTVLVALYCLTGLLAVALVVVWITTNRSRRNAGFASKRQLRSALSAATVLKAAPEIRPSTTPGAASPARTSTVSLTKHGSSRP